MQPEPSCPVEQLREFLRFAVPLRASELAYEYGRLTRAEAERLLTSMAHRGGVRLGHGGDELLFTDRAPRTGRDSAAVIRTTDDVVTAVAAAALLAGPTGVTVLGDHYGPARPADLTGPDSWKD